MFEQEKEVLESEIWRPVFIVHCQIYYHIYRSVKCVYFTLDILCCTHTVAHSCLPASLYTLNFVDKHTHKINAYVHIWLLSFLPVSCPFHVHLYISVDKHNYIQCYTHTYTHCFYPSCDLPLVH